MSTKRRLTIRTLMIVVLIVGVLIGTARKDVIRSGPIHGTWLSWGRITIGYYHAPGYTTLCFALTDSPITPPM